MSAPGGRNGAGGVGDGSVRRRGREREKEGERQDLLFCFSSAFFFPSSFQAFNLLDGAPPPTILRENGSSLLSLPIQMPLSSRNSLTAMLSSNVLTAIWVSLNPFKLKP